MMRRRQEREETSRILDDQFDAGDGYTDEEVKPEVYLFIAFVQCFLVKCLESHNYTTSVSDFWKTASFCFIFFFFVTLVFGTGGN